MSTATFGNIINSKLKSPITTEAVVSFPQKKPQNKLKPQIIWASNMDLWGFYIQLDAM